MALRGRLNRSILCLLHAFVGNSETSSHPSGSILEQYKQKQDNCDLDRFMSRAYTTKQRTRVMQAQAILYRYVEDRDTIRVLDYPGNLFYIQSM